MKQLLWVLGLLLLSTAIKAMAYISQHGMPKTLRPETTGDMVGMIFVIVLVLSFLYCLLYTLLKGSSSQGQAGRPGAPAQKPAQTNVNSPGRR